jgi:hypothetical protein
MFGPDYAHDVRNVSIAPAVSIHAYSPPLSDMNKYELDGDRLVPRETTLKQAETHSQERQGPYLGLAHESGALSIEQMLSAAATAISE